MRGVSHGDGYGGLKQQRRSLLVQSSGTHA